MSFIPKKEKILLERFMNAEEIRKSKRMQHYLIEKEKVNFRYSSERVGEEIMRLEKSLQEISKIREKRSLIKQIQKTSIKLNQSAVIKEKVRNQIITQEEKLNRIPRKESPIIQESTSNSIELPSLSTSHKYSSLSPKKQSNFLSPTFLRKVLRPNH